MKILLFNVVLGLVVMMTRPGFGVEDKDFGLNLVPWPKHVELGSGTLELTEKSRIVTADTELMPLAKVLSDEIYMVSGLRLSTAKGKAGQGDIALILDKSLKNEAYKLRVDSNAVVMGGDYRAVAWGTATLLQAMSYDGGTVTLPKMTVSDEPAYAFRSVMVDVARRWHPVSTLKDTIELLRFYKIRYLQLHLSDDPSFTFPSKAFPKLMTSKHSYTWEEMEEIVRYADERGVTIIPEIDVPAHSTPLHRRMPEIFGTVDPKTGEARSTGVLNMANEKAYEALDILVGELCDMFKSSPYIHVGADEVWAEGLKNVPEYMPYVKKHGLKLAEEGNVGELYCHFVVRMNEIVRKHDRQMIVWNNFPSNGTPNVKIPRDFLVMAWSGSPMNLVKEGFEIVNCCWLPLYMVPPQGRAPLPEWIYAWNARQASWWENATPIEIPADAPLHGAQICYWEQRYNQVIPILRPRVPALSERLWNPQLGKSFQDFKARSELTDRIIERIILPVTMEVQGLIDPNDVTFERTITVKLRSSAPGTIRYTLSKPWEEFPTAESPAYEKPITLDDTMTVSAQLFDSEGMPIGGVTQERFSKITPIFGYKIMGPTPHPVWNAMPDFEKLNVLRTGVTGRTTKDRVEQINRGMFVGVAEFGHVDVRVHGLWNPYAIELTGQLRILTGGMYTFKMRSRDGLSELQLGERTICETQHDNQEVIVSGTLQAGTYQLRIRHFWCSIFNDLNIQYKGPGMDQFEPFENLVLPLASHIKSKDLAAVPEETVFIDPKREANRSLAMDMPVKVSGETQGTNLPRNAVDGDTSNESGWHCGSSPAWLEVDLTKVHSINRVKIFTYYDGGRHYQYTIEASVDGKSWKDIVDESKNTKASTAEGVEHKFPPIKARYVRINLLKNSANPGVHLNEIMVFGED